MTAMMPGLNLRAVRRTTRQCRRRINRRFSGRTTKLMGAATCAGLAFAYLAVAWWVVFDIRIGPVIASLSETHGVHSGDMLGVVALALGVAFAIGSAMLLESSLHRDVRFAHRRH